MFGALWCGHCWFPGSDMKSLGLQFWKISMRGGRIATQADTELCRLLDLELGEPEPAAGLLIFSQICVITMKYGTHF